MHKKLEADLISLAHSILKMKNKDDVFALKEKSKEVYDRLSMLAFVEEYVNVTPNLETTKEELLEKVEKAFEAKEHKTVEEETLENVIHIQGDDDHIFPIKHIKNCIPIKKGTHIMVINKAKSISKIMIEALS